ncbi:hypothetical protein M9H77_30648 [Catharanthus roseus]|uniref:Uncharacterized protein n=1 Tax=Catharanthus roseus TaxID=4058 RepID=A0ACC0A1S0_CATRO|nr:hypothetical protein M9H77_30648 [Catharanthus roseus]
MAVDFPSISSPKAPVQLFELQQQEAKTVQQLQLGNEQDGVSTVVASLIAEFQSSPSACLTSFSCVTFGRFNPVGVHDFGRARLESDKPSSNFIDKSSVSEIGDIQRSNLEASDNDNDSDLNASTSSISNADNMAVMELIRNILDKLTPFANMHLLASISKPINVA